MTRVGVLGSVQVQSHPGDDQTGRVGDGGDALVQATGFIAEATAQGVFGDQRPPDLIADHPDGRGAGGEGFGQVVDGGGQVVVAEHLVAEPQGQAVDDHDVFGLQITDRGGQVQRCF
ncbi:hypothetical protein D3C72_2167660 [compost metagenome]